MPRARFADRGSFAESGIERLGRVLARPVDAGAAPGLVALVDRGGQTEVVCLGVGTVSTQSMVPSGHKVVSDFWTATCAALT